MSSILRVDVKDFLRGLIVAVLAVVCSLPLNELAKVIPFLAEPTVRILLATILGYLGKNLATDSEGRLGGRIQLY